MNPENDDEIARRVLLAAHQRGFAIHEESRVPFFGRPGLTDGSNLDAREARFTFILPDGRLVSVARWHGRREALTRACRAVEPYLVKFEVQAPRLKD